MRRLEPGAHSIEKQHDGELVVLVSHGVTISHLVGGAGLATGESVVVRAGAGPAAPLQVIGRLVVP